MVFVPRGAEEPAPYAILTMWVYDATDACPLRYAAGTWYLRTAGEIQHDLAGKSEKVREAVLQG